MKQTFKEYLIEARKNPEQNPRIPAIKQLEKYKDDPDIYITFTEVNKNKYGVDRNEEIRMDIKRGKQKSPRLPKVGLNTRSGKNFNTPNGVYTYPLKEVWSIIEKRDTPKSLPFAANRADIHVLRYSGKHKFVNDMYTDYTSKDYDTDMMKLKELYGDEVKNTLDLNKTMALHNYNSLDGYISATLSKIVKFGDIIDIDKLQNLYNKEDSDEVRYYIGEYNRDASKNDINTVIRLATSQAYNRSPVTSFWNVTRWLANGGNPDVGSGNKASTQKWTAILRKLGYVGFADKSGRGIIHTAEPTQAVFLDTSAYNVVELIHNKDYDDNTSKLTVFNDSNVLLTVTKLLKDSESPIDLKKMLMAFNNGKQYKSTYGGTVKSTVDNSQIFEKIALARHVLKNNNEVNNIIYDAISLFNTLHKSKSQFPIIWDNIKHLYDGDVEEFIDVIMMLYGDEYKDIGGKPNRDVLKSNVMQIINYHDK